MKVEEILKVMFKQEFLLNDVNLNEFVFGNFHLLDQQPFSYIKYPKIDWNSIQKKVRSKVRLETGN
jgi:hypothetical protein